MGSILWVPVMFFCASCGLYIFATNPPVTEAYDMSALKFPSNMEELSALSALLIDFKHDHLFYVLSLFAAAYLYKQTFAIPGSVFMNILAGALFGIWWGFLFACLLTAIGASFCYLLSRNFGKQYVLKTFPDRVTAVREKVEENRDSLLFFLLFLRFFPMSPNWFMNLAAPIVGIPLHLFFISVFIGLMPYNYICVQTGCMLSTVKSLNDIFTLSTTIKLAIIATVALLPGVIINYYRDQRNPSKAKKT